MKNQKLLNLCLRVERLWAEKTAKELLYPSKLRVKVR